MRGAIRGATACAARGCTGSHGVAWSCVGLRGVAASVHGVAARLLSTSPRNRSTFSASRDCTPAWRSSASISASISRCWQSTRACRTRSLATSCIASRSRLKSRAWPPPKRANSPNTGPLRGAARMRAAAAAPPPAAAEMRSGRVCSRVVEAGRRGGGWLPRRGTVAVLPRLEALAPPPSSMSARARAMSWAESSSSDGIAVSIALRAARRLSSGRALGRSGFRVEGLGFCRILSSFPTDSVAS